MMRVDILGTGCVRDYFLQKRYAILELKDSVALLQKVITHATRPENIYTHHWSVGDLLIWGQRSTIHRGAGDFPPDERRVKIRAIVEEFD